MPDGYRLFVNADRTHMVRIWNEDELDETVEVCTREVEGAIWGPPTTVYEEGRGE